MNNPEFKTKEQLNSSKWQKETKQTPTNPEHTDVFTFQITKEFPQFKEQISQLNPNQKLFLQKSLKVWKEDLIEDFPLEPHILKLWIDFIEENPWLEQITKLPEEELLLYMYTKLDEIIKRKEVEEKEKETKEKEKETKEKEKETKEKEVELELRFKKIKQASKEIQARLDANPQLDRDFQEYLSQKWISNFDVVGQNILESLAKLNKDLEDNQKLNQQEVITVSKVLFLQLQAQRWDQQASELLSYFNSPEIISWVDSLKELFPTLEQNLYDLAFPTWLSESFDQKTQEFAIYGEGIEWYEASKLTLNESARKRVFELFKEDIKQNFERNFPNDSFQDFEKWLKNPNSIDDVTKKARYQHFLEREVEMRIQDLQLGMNQQMRVEALKSQRDLITEIFDFPIQTLHGPINLAAQLNFEKWGIRVEDWLNVKSKLRIDDMPLEMEVRSDGSIWVTDLVHTPPGYPKYSAYQVGLEKLNDAFELPSLAKLLESQNMDISELMMQAKSQQHLNELLREQVRKTIEERIKQYNLEWQKPIVEAEVNYEVKKQQTLWNLIKYYQPPYEKNLFESWQLITPENPRTARIFELQKAFDITLREKPLELQRLWLQTQRPQIQYLLKESQLAGETWTWGDKFGTVDLLKTLWILPSDEGDWWENPSLEEVQEWLSADKLRKVADMLAKAKSDPSLLPQLPAGFKWDLSWKFPRVVRKE